MAGASVLALPLRLYRSAALVAGDREERKLADEPLEGLVADASTLVVPVAAAEPLRMVSSVFRASPAAGAAERSGFESSPCEAAVVAA